MKKFLINLTTKECNPCCSSLKFRLRGLIEQENADGTKTNLKVVKKTENKYNKLEFIFVEIV